MSTRVSQQFVTFTIPASLFRALAPWADAFVLSYAQIFFSRSKLVGLLLFAATFTSPAVGIGGAVAVAAAIVLPRLLRFSDELNRSGLYGYNALLVGLGGAALFQPGPRTVALILFGVLAAVMLTSAMHSVMSSVLHLPALTGPFLVVFYLMLAVAPFLEIGTIPFPGRAAPAWTPPFPALVEGYLTSLGTMFFVPHALAGSLVLAALLRFSRIAALLSLVAYGLVAAVMSMLPVGADPTLTAVVAFNVAFVAIALGGIWFVPSMASFGVALLGGTFCLVLSLGCYPVLSQLGFPLLILPFNLTLAVWLVAMRQRVVDGHPKAVDFEAGSPEQNLAYYRTRIARFGARYGVRIHAPFRGRWVCTQGVGGVHTHQGPWRDGLDFEVRGGDGRTYRDRGQRREDYLCYRLPVLAVADGTVVKVVDGVPDNAMGDRDLAQPWGNAVIVFHAVGLYSVVAHLQAGGIAVHEGQIVRRGETLGRCGSSGRSPVPHLHFQLQATALLGAPTIRMELHDVIRCDEDREALQGTFVPEKDQEIRNITPRADVASLLRFELGRPVSFQVSDGQRTWREEITAEIGLAGDRSLRSSLGRARLFYDETPRLMTVYDVLGPGRSMLHLVRASIARVPLESNARLQWNDVLPVEPLLPWRFRLGVLVRRAGFRDGVEMRYGAHRTDGTLIIEGASAVASPDGEPLVRTRALLRQGHGLVSVQVTVAAGTRNASRIAAEAVQTQTDGTLDAEERK